VVGFLPIVFPLLTQHDSIRYHSLYYHDVAKRVKDEEGGAAAMSAGEEQSSGRPWDRQSRESEEAHAAFAAWLGQAHRNVAALARELGLSLSLLWRWHKRHRWQERALAFDGEMARQREADLRKHRHQVMERRSRRAQEADAAGRVLLRRGVRGDPHSGDVHSLDDTALKHGERYLRLATDIEDRLLAGTEPEAPATSIEEEVWRLEDPALRRLIGLARGPGQHQNEEDADDGTARTDQP